VAERRFTYRAYGAFLDRLAASDARTVLHRELAAGLESEQPLVALRHDVDDRIDSALVFAEAERARGIRATYFVLHTASYYADLRNGAVVRRDTVLEPLHRLQELGHEVGWHNDLLTLLLAHGIDPVAYLADELAWLRGNGIDVVGTAAHGARLCHELGYHNNDLFLDWPESAPGKPRRESVRIDGDEVALGRARLADFGLEYEAYHLDHAAYFSDARFDAGGRRWHPDRFDPSTLPPGATAIVLTHACIWDRSVLAKYARLPGRAVRRVRQPPG
jgi:hypothetical protein